MEFCRLRKGAPAWLAVMVGLLVLFAGAAPAEADYAAGKTQFDDGFLTEAERKWRVCAWREDEIFCQVELGHQYESGENFEKDNVEAYVWYYLALINPSRHGISLLTAYEAFEHKATGRESLLKLQKIITREEWNEVEDRLNYILSTRGAIGMVRLGEIYDEQRGTDDEIAGTVRSDLKKDSFTASSRVVYAIRREFRSGGAWFGIFRGQIGGGGGSASGDGSSDRAGFIRRNNLQAMKYYLLAARFKNPAGILLEKNMRAQLGSDVLDRAEELAEEWTLPDRYPGPQYDASDRIIRAWYDRN